jgi:type II secretory pathway pseudopilin PulG
MRRKHSFIKRFQACTHTRLHSCTPTRLHAYTHAHLHALTLIELVIVCAIIVVLVGIIWVVVFSPLREGARQVQCMNNLRQIHLALMMYRADYGAQASPVKGAALDPADLGLPCIPARYPPAVDLSDQLAPYLKDSSVWICPNDPGTNPPPSQRLPGEIYPSYGRLFSPFCHYDENCPRDNFNWWLMDRSRRRVAACGERMPLLVCPFHGHGDSYVIVLRWNGIVEGKYVWIPSVPSDENYCLD